jgi:predicted RNase H-like nuclease (RuvC/YqgF family)
MAEPADMIVPMLREMRSEMKAGFDRMDSPLEALEKAQNSFRQALTADSLLSKLVTGGFEERIEAVERSEQSFEKRIEMLERKVKELEASK